MSVSKLYNHFFDGGPVHLNVMLVGFVLIAIALSAPRFVADRRTGRKGPPQSLHPEQVEVEK